MLARSSGIRNARSISLILGWIVVLVPFQLEGQAWERKGCLDSRALYQREWPAAGLGSADVNLGGWELPVSVDHPESMTKARVEIRYIASSTDASFPSMELLFSFPDPKPLGIPFTFEKIQLKWSSRAGQGEHELDWTRDCQQVGRSLFPGQSWSVRIPMDRIRSDILFETLSVGVWGGRN